MSALISSPNDLDMPLSPASAAKGVYTTRPHFDGTRGLAALLLAALVAAMVVVAEHLISTWADGHLLLAWVLLWIVIFASLALFASTARKLARRVVAALDNWSRSMAEARAEARLWDIARHDPRLMEELMQARMRASAAAEAEAVEAADDFSAALAPLGMEGPAAAMAGRAIAGRQAGRRRPHLNLHYI